MKTVVLNHDMVRIILRQDKDLVGYVLSIRMRDGSWVQQNPYEANQRGLIGAMSLAMDVLAGKVLLLGVEATKDIKDLDFKSLEVNPKQVLLDSGGSGDERY